MMNLCSDLRNPYLDNEIFYNWTDVLAMNPFYPCIKYKIPANPQLDGTDYFIVAESMHQNWMTLDYVDFGCSLSFTCKNDQKAFYKLMKDCLQ